MIAQIATVIDPAETDFASAAGNHPSALSCYSLTLFTDRWKEVRDFYVGILNAEVLSERPDRYCEMKLGGLPLCLRSAEQGEAVSYLHLYFSLPNRTRVLRELQARGIVITRTGPYINFRDPEGRVVKLSDESSFVE